MTVAVGSKLRNNDPRKNGETVEVIAVSSEIGGSFAYYQAGKRKARVNLKRVFTDGRQRAQGYNLVA